VGENFPIIPYLYAKISIKCKPQKKKRGYVFNFTKKIYANGKAKKINNVLFQSVSGISEHKSLSRNLKNLTINLSHSLSQKKSAICNSRRGKFYLKMT
jgi:hypothetical protein